jgi:hypothetical protein
MKTCNYFKTQTIICKDVRHAAAGNDRVMIESSDKTYSMMRKHLGAD